MKSSLDGVTATSSPKMKKGYSKERQCSSEFPLKQRSEKSQYISKIDFPPWAVHCRCGGGKNYEIAYQSISHSALPRLRLNLFSLIHWELGAEQSRCRINQASLLSGLWAFIASNLMQSGRFHRLFRFQASVSALSIVLVHVLVEHDNGSVQMRLDIPFLLLVLGLGEIIC